jgi:hypothetical protein
VELLTAFFVDRIVTLEDALEALLQEQIYDEMDTAGRNTLVAPSESPTSPPDASDDGSFQLEGLT